MPLWIIEPRDPLIARDGRPFGPNPGARATSLPFPLPSTLIGALRSHAGSDADGVFDPKLRTEVLKWSMRGPLLAQLHDGQIAAWLFPAPADVLLVKDANAHMQRHWLAPYDDLPPAAQHNLPEPLRPIGPKQHLKGKAATGPRFWRDTALWNWLHDPTAEALVPFDGLEKLPNEQRMHVQIDPATQMAAEGMLFQTSGLEFMAVSVGTKSELEDAHAQPGLDHLHAYALVTEVDRDFAHFRGGYAPLGGERRTMHWRQSEQSLPVCPPAIRAAIQRDKRCRVVLLTPAIFAAGWEPTWLCNVIAGLQLAVQAAALPRPQPIGGWDLALQRNKPSRRAAAAGSVYFVELNGDAAQIDTWIDRVWMQNISDDEQDRRDGFGLAVVGVWSRDEHRFPLDE